MIQNFHVTGGPGYGRRNLPKLRGAMAAAGLDAFLIPHEDEYQNEYLPDANERLMWATGFTGSAGAAIVMTDRAVMFVDGRYTIQVRSQVDPKLFDYTPLEGGAVAKWLRTNIAKDHVVGYDPRLHSPRALDAIRKAVTHAGGELKAMDTNPIDAAWEDRPAQPMARLTVQPDHLAGERMDDKIARIAQTLKDRGADATVITSPASIAWLLNVRGGDVACTPLPLSTLILGADGSVQLFINRDKITPEITAHFGNAVSVADEDALPDALSAMSGQTVSLDPDTASAWFFETVKAAGANVIRERDPIALPKATKNAAEIAATTAAHRRDAVPLIRFLHWLDTEGQSGEIDEIAAATKLESLRSELPELRDLSFETISGAGANGAMAHYRVNTDTVLGLKPGSLFLVDSGGQYPDGTTDVTRTVPIGEPTAEMRQRFTLVLKGHIALARIRFPEGTTGSNLDALARAPLWMAGLDYDHGTGHGVGVYLGVHEGPQRISKAPNTVALRPGMIVSNEPGFYKEGEYGIRIENLQYVTEPEAIAGGEREMMGFATLTLAPIHRRLIDTDLLTPEERDYLDGYHARVLEEIGSKLDPDITAWLEMACAPL